MSIGADLKEISEDIGVSYAIIRDAGNVSGEYMPVPKPINQSTKPFIREFCQNASFNYDSAIVNGDVVKLDATSEFYIVVHKTALMFENEVIRYDSMIYKCNVESGELMRPSGEIWDSQTYHKVPVFSSVKANVHALQTDALFYNDLNTKEDIGLLRGEREELYIPSTIGVQELDRWQPTSGEYYMVTSILPRRFSGVDVAILEEDRR